jgi:hypothetical protein
MSGRNYNTPGVLLAASAAGHRARTPVAVERKFAVNRTRLDIAVLHLGQTRASDSAVGGCTGNATLAGLGPGTTGQRARAPLFPCGDDAVDRALVHVANLGLSEVRASNTAVGSVSDDLPGPVLRARAAGGGAGRPSRPRTNDTVNRAGVRIAANGLGKVRADSPHVHGTPNNTAGAGLGAGATGLGAGGPSRPSGHFAVYGAWAVRARLGLAQVRARLATMDGSRGDCALA